MKTFHGNNPQKFKEDFNPDDAKSGIVDIEKLFITMTCVDTNRVTLLPLYLSKNLKHDGDLLKNNWKLKE